MKHFPLLLFVICILVSTLHSQQWAKRAGGSGTDIGFGICTDTYGNCYVTGTFSGTADFGTTSLTSHGGSDMFVAKYNSSGAIQWAVNAGASGNSAAGNGICVDGSGNVYVTGYFHNLLYFGSDSVVTYRVSNIFIAKLNSSGVWQWVAHGAGTSLTNTSSHTGQRIALDAAGNVYITGAIVDNDTLGSNAISYSGAGSGAFVAKCSSSGTWGWAQTCNASVSYGYGIAVDGSGNVFASGVFQGSCTIGSQTITSAGGQDGYILKFNSSGDIQWLHDLGSSNSDYCRNVCLDANANAYVSGTFSGAIYFGSVSLNSGSVFLAKYNSDGVCQWASSLPSGNCYGCATDASGNSYLCGYFAGSVTYGSSTLNSAGGADVYVAKIDASGNVVDAISGGGSGSDYCWNVALDPAGNRYATGFFNGSATFGGTTLTSAGSNDIFIIKIGSASNSPGLTFTAPMGPQTFCTGSSLSIQWTSYSVSNVLIQLSSDGGTSYATVATVSAQDGSNSYSFTIPSTTPTGNSYRFRVVDASDATRYSAATSNSTMAAPLTITTQPLPALQTLCQGSNVNVSVVVSGSSPSYQWRKDGVNLSSQTSATLSITNFNSQQAGVYDCVITGLCGNPVSTSTLTLQFAATTAVNVHPMPVRVCVGQNASFSVGVSGEGLTYQWKKNNVPISAATSSSYQLSSVAFADSGNYSCLVTGTCGPAVSSNPAHLSVYDAPVFSEHPQSQNLCEGATLSLKATVSNDFSATYEWAKDGVTLLSNSRVTGVNTNTLLISSVQPSDAGSYQVRTFQCASLVVSNAAVVGVYAAPSISKQPHSLVVVAGAKASFSVVASGDQLRYQWYKNASAIASATDQSYSIASVQKSDEAQYKVVISGRCGAAMSSAMASLTLSDTPVPVLNLESDQISFGAVHVGATKSLKVKLSNSGTAVLNVQSISLNGADKGRFRVDTTQLSIAPGTSASITLSFHPILAGECQATLGIHSNAGSEQDLNIKGAGIEHSLSPLLVQFNNNDVGHWADTVFSLCNADGVALKIPNVVLEGDTSSFSVESPNFVTQLPITIGIDSCLTLHVRWKPQHDGANSLRLILHTSDDTDTLLVSGSAKASSVPNTTLENALVLVPNPASEQLRILGLQSCSHVQVIDMLGRVRLQSQVLPIDAVLNIKDLEPGLYFVSSEEFDHIRVHALHIIR